LYSASDDPLRANLGVKHLDDAFLAEVVERLAQLLGFGRIAQHHAAQDFRREIRQAGEADLVLFGQRITDTQGAVVWDADDVAGQRDIGEFTVLREKHDRRMDRNRLAKTRRSQFHAALERARDQPHERDPVAVLRVHVGLHLKDETADLVAPGRNFPGIGRLGARRRRIARNRLDQVGDAEALKCRSEVDRRQVAGAIGIEIELGVADLRQVDFLGELGRQFGRIDHLAAKLTAVALGHAQPPACEIEHAMEQTAHADRPALRRHI
jgi:hypothetical protein